MKAEKGTNTRRYKRFGSIAALAVTLTVLTAACSGKAPASQQLHSESSAGESGVTTAVPDEHSSFSIESSSPDQAIVLSVLYYGEVPVGAVAEETDVSALYKQLCDALEEPCTPGEELTVRTVSYSPLEQLPEVLSQEKLLGLLSEKVQQEYTKGCVLYIDGTFFAASEDAIRMNSAVNKYLYERVENLGSGFRAELRNADIREGETVRKDAVLSEEQLRDLLLFCDPQTVLSEEVEYYNDLVTYLKDNQIAAEILPVLIEEEFETLTEELPFETVYQIAEGQYDDYEKVESEGTPGKVTVTYLVIREDGKEISRTPVQKQIAQLPEDRVILVGALSKGDATGTFAWPTLSRRLTSLFGWRTIFGGRSFHGGLDIGIPTGTEVYAGDGGTVVWAGDAGNNYGIYVIIDHGNGFCSYYGHLSKVAVAIGDKLAKGDFVGYSGATGRVTGPHLHFELRLNGEQVDPQKYLPKE